MTFTHDHARSERLGMPEAIFCAGKDDAALEHIFSELGAKPDQPTLFTRLSKQVFERLDPSLSGKLDYDPDSGTGILHSSLPERSDPLPWSRQAHLTCRWHWKPTER